MASTAIVSAIQLQTGTTRTLHVTWKWDKDNTESYQVKWKYRTVEGGYQYSESISTTTGKESLYNAPENAVSVTVLVQPIAKTVKKNGVETRYWTAAWAQPKSEYYFKNSPPDKPSTPSLTLEKDGKKQSLTASLDNVDINAYGIQFELVKDNDPSTAKINQALIRTSHVSYTWSNVAAGSVYKVRCRGYRGTVTGEWTEYSANVKTAPSSPIINNIEVVTETIIRVTWEAVASAEKYTIEYVPKDKDLTKEECFEAIGSQKQSVTVAVEEAEIKDNLVTKTISNLTSGQEYYIRISAANDSSSDDTPDWSEIWSFIVGTTPTAPTTWSSTTTAMVGESLNLYWVHNSKDNSRITWSELYLYVDGIQSAGSPYTISNEAYEDSLGVISCPELKDDENVRVCHVNTSSFPDGSELTWKVRTAGAKANVYGDYSVLRTIDIYTKPSIDISLKDSGKNALELSDDVLSDGSAIYILKSFPFYLVVYTRTLINQKPIGYYVNVTANESYETVDNVGNDKIVSEGSTVYSKYFDITDQEPTFTLSANDMDLSNNVSYKVSCTVAMDSGLTAEESANIKVFWEEEVYSPMAEIGINQNDLSAYIRPYANNSEDILLSVYRKEFDGSFTELATNIQDGANTYITDPHPALDFARYRIIAKSKTTGAISYTDTPAYPVNEKSIIIQWDEKWQNFQTDEEEEMDERPWNGSMLKLPYNIDISDSYSPDVNLVEYVGRKRPVSYYGTQIRESSSWSIEIPKDDIETLYAIRRLAVWMGDVYVREPSGTGYWAQVTVSYSQTHCEVTIPVTFDIKRVEGGV